MYSHKQSNSLFIDITKKKIAVFKKKLKPFFKYISQKIKHTFKNTFHSDIGMISKILLDGIRLADQFCREAEV